MKHIKLILFNIATLITGAYNMNAQYGEGGPPPFFTSPPVYYTPPPSYTPPIIPFTPNIPVYTPPPPTFNITPPSPGGGGGGGSFPPPKKNPKNNRTNCRSKSFGGTKKKGKVIGVFFKGNLSGSGKDITSGEARDTGKRFNDLKDVVTNSGKKFVPDIIAPGATITSAVNNGLSHITSHYSPGDQIVIYGFSWGGDAAVELSHSLNQLSTPIPVNLLVTVDGSDGPLGNETVNNRIPDNVGTNLNVYQTTPSGTAFNFPISGAPLPTDSNYSLFLHMSGMERIPASRGNANLAINSNRTTVINKNATANDVNHSNIQNVKRIKDLIKKRFETNVLGCP